MKRRYEAYAQLELLLLLHTFGDFSSPNWGTVKLKWMLPENHTQRNIVTNTSKDTDTDFQETKPRVKPMQIKKSKII